MSRRLIPAVVVMLAAAACGGGSDDPEPTAAPAEPVATPPPTTVAREPAPTTTAPAATTTTGPPPAPTTTTAAPLDAAALLSAMNAAMGRNPEFIGAGQGYIKESAETPNDEAFVTQLAVGGGPAGLDFWQLTLLEFNTPGLSNRFYVQERAVAGVDYEQDPETGVWSIDESDDPDPVSDAFAGSLMLTGLEAQAVPGGFRLAGGYAPDPNIDRVTVDIDAETSRIVRIAVEGSVPRSELGGLVDPAGADLVLFQQVNVTSYDIDTPDIAPPPVGIATKLVPEADGPFFTSIPADWERLSDAELQSAGFTDGYIGPRGLALVVLVEDLTGTGINSLGAYADAVAVALADFDLTYFDAATTLQGRFIWLISGTDPLDGTGFRRLMFVTPEGAAVNLTFVQGIDPATGEPTAAWPESQELIDFMINGFLLNS